MSTHRITQQHAFVLHTRPHSESSLIVELVTENYGRIGVLSKGARRPKSRLRGVLQPFQPLVVAWSGKGELPILTSAEQGSELYLLDYKSRVCGFYANELLYKLIQRRDPHPQLFKNYIELMRSLNNAQQRELGLRSFEKRLLSELGYALILDREIDTQELINTELLYQYIPERGPVMYQGQGRQGVGLGAGPGVGLYSDDTMSVIVSGMVLHSIERNQYHNDQIMQQAKRFMRQVLSGLLGHKNIYSRDLFYLS